MNTVHMPTEEAQAIADLFQCAAQELLHDYQRNKEATRHHASGAFRAALHHARMSCRHSSAAHEYLTHALERSGRMASEVCTVTTVVADAAVRRDGGFKYEVQQR